MVLKNKNLFFLVFGFYVFYGFVILGFNIES